MALSANRELSGKTVVRGQLLYTGSCNDSNSQLGSSCQDRRYGSPFQASTTVKSTPPPPSFPKLGRTTKRFTSLYYISSISPEVETVQYKSTDSTEYTLLYISTQFACECGVLTTKIGGSIRGYVVKKEAFYQKKGKS